MRGRGDERKNMLVTNSDLLLAIEGLAMAARRGLEAMTPTQRGIGFADFPRGTCGPVSELMGRIVLERTGHLGRYVVGDGHPALSSQQSHAWLEVDRLIVDLTYDQFLGTGLSGWVFDASDWHAAFETEVLGLCLKPEQWGRGEYPYAAYVAMARACSSLA